MRGECNRRAFEAACCGALLFQERGNAETAAFFRDREECVCYGEDDLEDLLEHYLTHEDERRALAAAGQARVQGFGFEALWREALDGLEAEWPEVRRGRRPPPAPGRGGPAPVPHLAGPGLRRPARPGAGRRAGRGAGRAARLGVPAPRPRPRAGMAARRAAPPRRLSRRPPAASAGRSECDSDDAVAGLSLVEALAAAGHGELAAEGARRTLALPGPGRAACPCA